MLNVFGVDVPVVLGNGDGEAGKLTQPVTLYLTITVLSNAASSIFLNNNPEIPTRGDGSPAEEYSTSSIVSDSGGPTIHTSPDPLLPSSDPLPVEIATPMPDGQAEMSPTEKALIALHRADEAKKPVDRKNKWKGAVSRIKWVMDALHPFAKMAYGMVSAIPENSINATTMS
ncbi:hypothetical protein EDB84DRAFT_1442270 [Lactarius hengduanensis]|nr:hypothetical protein EDB84DRAFT_1442270 [Lactarius hengduanensis]